MNNIAPIEKFAATLAAMGHACAPSPAAISQAAVHEDGGNGFEAGVHYLREAGRLYEEEVREGLPVPVTPTVKLPMSMEHTSCTGRTLIRWSPGKFAIINLKGEWQYWDDTIWEHIEEDCPPSPEDLVIRFLLLWGATPQSDFGRSLAHNESELYRLAIAKFSKRSPEWAQYLGFSD